MDDERSAVLKESSTANEVSRFTESYASFTRVINTLQRKYIELEEGFSAQNQELAEANTLLVELTERNLQATEFLNGILHSISAGVVAVDRDGRITHFNLAAERILGLKAEDVRGSLYRDMIPPGTPSEANALRTSQRAQPVESTERQIELTNGIRRFLSVSTAVMRDNEGQPAGAVEVFQDMTKMKKMEQEFARLNTLAAMGEMAATIAHEVRNPLSGIGGFAALLTQDLDKSDPRFRLADNIRRGVETLNHTVTTLLDYARSEKTNQTEVVLRDYLISTIRQFGQDNPTVSQDVDIVLGDILAEVDEPIEVSIDPILMKQVFRNLFANAIESFSGNGCIEINVEYLLQDEGVRQWGEKLLLESDEGVVVINIADDGPGIEKDNLEKIFAPFFTTRMDGNGLGLAMVWKIMKAHGGNIVAENRDSGGAVFRLLLPFRTNTDNMEHRA
ncbi:MAG: PAS domain S-box protein [candidate division Zixibacteria bacterium]|nr:PAS domain S-box protein [candidate division Zixibacteria bacterium]